MNNPFNITKADDFIDSDIQKYWVDLFDEKSKIKPLSPMPILIKGSKGSGKTHLLKYFSFELQKIRNSTDFNLLLKKDKYIGIYMRCSGLNSERFKGKGLQEDRWNEIFAYYNELWFGQKLISIIKEFKIEPKDELHIIQETVKLFDQYSYNPSNLSELNESFNIYQKELDYEVKNMGFRRNPNPDFDLKLNPGALIYGIPRILSSLDIFKGVSFLYIIDEFENITLSQQKIFNSLYRERNFPGSFRIGGRLYGFYTFNTMGSLEENREDSEYELIELDRNRREEPKKYKEFIINICIKKLNNNNYINIKDKNDFIYYFESFNENYFLDRLSNSADRLKDMHIKTLEKQLNVLKISPKEIKIITSNLVNENKIIEKVKYLLFYRNWKKNKKNLLDISKEIKQLDIQYSSDSNIIGNDINIVLEKYKIDMIDQLSREASIEIESYINIESYIKMSSGAPRNFINIIKEAYDYEYHVANKTPFTDNNKISITSQLKSIKRVSEWFTNANRIPYNNYDKINPLLFLTRLGDFLRKLRFSNIPPECSINLFSVDETFYIEQQILFKKLLDYSFIVDSNDRRDKNESRKNYTFFINGTLSPSYDLAISRRGVVKLNYNILNALVENNESLLKDKIQQYNAPFEQIKPTLF